MSARAPLLMVQGTSSSAGKSTLVAGLCRLFARRGVHVAPFKAQNMSNNAAVCADGGEIGRAQYTQALAARVPPTTDMNPVLLKPQHGGSQVVLLGRAVGTQTAADYFARRRESFWPIVVDALDRLRATHDLVIAEGAGSPAEINLRAHDITNMQVALHAAPDCDVLLVGDIDRGGVFAALLGTWEWLAPNEQKLVRGFVLNRFRGDASLLAPAPGLLQARTGVPVLGVVPFVSDLGLPEEDAATLSPRSPRDSSAVDAQVEIAVPHLPHLSNFDELGPLAAEPGVWLRYVDRPEELRAPDLVILPGSKATVADLVWLWERGLAERVIWLACHGTPILGLCGGFQMLGATVSDPQRRESEHAHAAGLGLLPLATRLEGEKTLARVSGSFAADLEGFWSCLRGERFEGYEIHLGSSSLEPDSAPLLDVQGRPNGTVRGDVAGTYIHGALEQSAPRQALVRGLAARRGFLSWQPKVAERDALDRLADVLEASLDLSGLPTLQQLRFAAESRS